MNFLVFIYLVAMVILCVIVLVTYINTVHGICDLTINEKIAKNAELLDKNNALLNQGKYN